MTLSEVFIRRPVATGLLSVALACLGALAYQTLPVSALPQVDYPTIVINTALPGASSETMAATVTTVLERQLGQMPAVTQLLSVSSAGTSQITVQFALERSIDAAEQDVQASINAAANLLPTTLPAPPTYNKANQADTPILTLAVRSRTLPLSQVDDYADSVLAQKLSQVAGVGLVSLSGGQKPAVRVQADPEVLAGLGLTLEDVRQALVAQNVNQPKGSLDGPRQAYALATDDQVFGAAAFADLVVAYRQGAPVRLRAVARVVDGVENAQLAGWADGERAILLSIMRQPGANVIGVADRIHALLPQLRASLPAGTEVEILSDRTATVRASIDDVQLTLLLTMALVVGVIFVFLRDVRATLIPALALPLSLLGTFVLMAALGYSLNNLSLMALTISTGFVVDDAIVMLENISRFYEAGATRREAALQGAAQMGFTIVSLTVSLIAVLIPLLFMGGLLGRLFREFAVTLSAAIAVSAVLSLTLTPSMCASLLRTTPAQSGRLAGAFEAGFAALLRGYEISLRWVLARPRTTLVVTMLTAVLSVALAISMPKGFFPQQDTGLLVGMTEAPADISFAAMARLQQAMARAVAADADVQSVASAIGSDGMGATANAGRLTITLRPRPQRRSSMPAVLARLQQSAAGVAGMALYLQPVQDLQLDSRLSRTQYQYTLEGAVLGDLQQAAPRVLQALQALPQLRDVASDQQGMGLQTSLRIDRDTAARLGIAAQAIDDTLYDAFGQRIVSTVFTQLNQYRVILEIKPELAASPQSLRSLYVQSGAGQPVPLSAFTSWEPAHAPLSISHQGQFPAVTLSFNVAPGVALGDAMAAIDQSVAQLALPRGVAGSYQGAAQAFLGSLQTAPYLVLAALFTVYVVLGVLYESTIHPLTILSTLPSAGVGALLALRLCGEDFGVIALIGIILLIGIVKKNAIMMIDFALEQERHSGVAPQQAIFAACLLRFRPIMMTTCAALLGALPLALGTGMGHELRRPLGISIVGGLLVSQVLTLYTTPVVYLTLDRAEKWLRRATRRAPV